MHEPPAGEGGLDWRARRDHIAPMTTVATAWCPVCSTRHEGLRRCPGELVALEPERHGFRVDVRTRWGVESYGVLVAPVQGGWRARILTYPNVLWLVPGGRASLKFVGETAAEAEGRAVRFIREHCDSRGFGLLPAQSRAEPGPLPSAAAVARAAAVAARKIRFLPLRYGLVTPSNPGGTGNLSETGLFVVTGFPLRQGSDVRIEVNLAPRIVALTGEVVWLRPESELGRSRGMGVRLVTPPPSYVDFVRSLP